FFADLPVARRGGGRERVEEAEARWSANMPLAMVDQYRTNLKRLRAIAFDVGRRDQFTHILPTNRAFAAALTRNGMAHPFGEYDGDHNDRAPLRIEANLLPFFSRVLDFGEESQDQSTGQPRRAKPEKGCR